MHHAPREQLEPDDFESWELDLTSRLVQDFLAEQKLPGHLDRYDLYQECLLHWWQQRSRYEAARGASRTTYLRRVVRAKLQDLARRWKAAKRGSGQASVSLDAPASSGDPERPTLRDTLPDPETWDPALALDLQRLTGRLSARQRRIVAGVTAGMAKIELSKRLEISRDTLHEEMRRIRQIFREEGLAPHLE